MSWVIALSLLSVAGAEPTGHRSSQLCEGGTHLLFPRDGGETDPEAGLVFADRACEVPPGADPDDPIVLIPVHDLLVDVDGEPAALVPFEGADLASLWRVEPRPQPGATVTIVSCEADDEERCGYDDVLRWTFEISDASTELPPLVEPVVGELDPMGTTDPFSGEVWMQWAFSVERGGADPGMPMIVDASLEPSGVGVELFWAGPEMAQETVVLGAPEGEDVCVTVQAVDVYGRRAPTVERCASSGADGGSCRTGGGSGAWGLLIVLLGLRRRRRAC